MLPLFPYRGMLRPIIMVLAYAAGAFVLHAAKNKPCNVCYSYKVPFSFQVQEGGYIYESGEYARETSLVLTLIDVDKTVVNDIAKDLCAFFHQESVLVTESHLQAHFVRETFECGGEETL